jgi:branched-chain amino acid transport system ATP-binding protein
LLSVEGLEAGYGRFPVVHRVSLRVGPQEIVAIVGPNGAGKSTLLKAIFRLLPILNGRVECDGLDLASLRAEELPPRGICLVPQMANTFPDLSVQENLRVSFSTLTTAKAAEALHWSFETFPALAARAGQTARTLSGGERQMLAIASAAALGPTLLALDEPTAGLAPTIVHGLIRTISGLRERGTSVMWVVEEDPLEILPHVDRVYVLAAGLVTAELAASDLLDDRLLIEMFFGGRR